MDPVHVQEGDSPVVLGLPHTGTLVPETLRADLNARGQSLSDTDWHVDRLYADLLPEATTVRATFHRYVIDANRDPSGQSLYPGQATTGLVPLTDFDGHSIWEREPDAAAIEKRLTYFHQPYHAALAAQMARVKAKHGVAVLYDCHSIRSLIPRLFEGELPDFNIGDNEGRTCHPAITQAVAETCAAAEGYSHVVNGRFKGGWTTRHYGRPSDGWHAIQMELSQRSHLAVETAPYDYAPEKAATLRPVLKALLTKIETLALEGALT